jgi:hypothetical protein
MPILVHQVEEKPTTPMAVAELQPDFTKQTTPSNLDEAPETHAIQSQSPPPMENVDIKQRELTTAAMLDDPLTIPIDPNSRVMTARKWTPPDETGAATAIDAIEMESDAMQHTIPIDEPIPQPLQDSAVLPLPDDINGFDAIQPSEKPSTAAAIEPDADPDKWVKEADELVEWTRDLDETRLEKELLQ